MNKLFKHTKKLVLLVLTVVLMAATSMVVLAEDTKPAPTPTNLTNLTVGSKFTEVTAGEFSYDTIGKKDVVKTLTLYTNGEEASLEETNYKSSETLCVVATIKADGDKNGEVNGTIGKEDVKYVNGYFTAKSSDESVATVEIVKKDGKQYIVITGEKNGSATITLKEQYPLNPKNAKKIKTTTVKVTVKTLADDITFNSDVVKTGADNEQYVNVGYKGTVTLGTGVNADASSKGVKYELLDDAKNFIKISTKGVISTRQTTETSDKGYVEVRVYAQDQSYKVGKKTVKSGVEEVIRVTVNAPEVNSAKILNAALTNQAAYEASGKNQKVQAYSALNLKTNDSSDLHTYQLQVVGYAGTQWAGEERLDAVTFTSSKPKVATVDKNGLITAVGNGSTVITVVPKDGVKLAKKEAVTIKVNVTTDVERINIADVDVTSLAYSTYTIKASTNANVSVKADKTLTYEIVKEKTTALDPSAEKFVVGKKTYNSFYDQIVGVSGAKNVAKGKIKSNFEGTVTVKVASKGQPDVNKEIQITFIDPVTSITATVKNYTAKSVSNTTSTTLYIDGVNKQGQVSNNSTVIDTVVMKKINGKATNLNAVTATSKNPNIAEVVLVKDADGNEYFVINAKSAGKTDITIAANDGSKKKAKTIKVTVVQKVKDITIENAGVVGEENVIYFPLNENTASSFKFVASANVANAGLTYEWTAVPDSTLTGITFKKTTLSVTEDRTIAMQEAFAVEGAEQKVLLGTLKVTARDVVDYSKKDAEDKVIYDASAVDHVAACEEVLVYAIPAPTYMTVEQFNKLVDDALIEKTGVASDLTLLKGEKFDLGEAIEVPVDITTRTLTWAAKTKADGKLVSVKNGVLTASKLTDKATVTVSAKCIVKETKEVVTETREINVRVIASQADFDKELNTQITTLLKENNYTWLGAKPTFNAKKATITLAISDITMSKDDANSEMRGRLEDVMKVFKTAAQTAIWGTDSQYKAVSVVDTYTGKTWYVTRNEAEFTLVEDNEVIGTYTTDNVDAAISDLSACITSDIDEIVEWANKNLKVTLVALNGADGYNTRAYESKYTVEVTIKDADLESYLDAKVNEAVAKFAAANEAVKETTGIQAITYDAAKNATAVDIYDANVAVADAYAAVKEESVAALEEIFANAAQARLQVVSPILTDEEEATCDVTYTRAENSDVNALVEELFAKVSEKMDEGSALRNLEGTTIFATVDFNFSGKVYTKEYTVTFKRTMEAIDADVDARINTEIAKVDVSKFGKIEYVADDNKAIVSINVFNTKLTDAKEVTGVLESVVTAVAGDAFAEGAEINGVNFDKIYIEGKVSASEVLKAVKPDWYPTETTKPEKEVLARELSELVGTTAEVVVYYGAERTVEKVGETYVEKVAYSKPVTYTVEFVGDLSAVDEAVDVIVNGAVADVNAAAVADGYAYSLELITGATYNAEENNADVTLNALDKAVDVMTFRGTGLCTLLKDTLIEAQKTGASKVYVNLVTGEEDVPTAPQDLKDVEITNETVIDLFGLALGAAEVETIEELDGKQFAVTIEYVWGDTVKPVYDQIQYTIDFVLEYPQGSTDQNPISLRDQYVEPKLAPGMVVYYTGKIGEMEVTIWDENASILYKGEVFEYSEEDGCVKATIDKVSTMDIPVVGIYNGGEEDAMIWTSFAYPMGHMMNPEYIEGYVEGSIEEGDKEGYFYTYTAAGEGTLKLWFVSKTEGVDADITVQNMWKGGMYSLTAEGVEEDGDKVLNIEVEAGDELMINVASIPSKDDNGMPVYSALEYNMGMTVEYPLGSVNNPVSLEVDAETRTVSVTVPAGKEVYYTAAGVGNSYLTIENVADAIVYVPTYFGNMEYTPVNGTISAQMGMGMYVTFGIMNNGEEEATYTLSFVIPEGTRDNPKSIETGSYNTTADEYFYQWTATEAGTMTFDISATVGGWSYSTQNIDANDYNDTHWSDDSEVVSVEKWEVNEGDVITIWVGKYYDMALGGPAEAINFTISFEAATTSVVEEVVEEVVDVTAE